MKVFPVLCFICVILKTSYSEDHSTVKTTDAPTKLNTISTKSTSGITPSTTILPLTFKCDATSKITSVTGLPNTELILIDGTYCHISDHGCDWKLSKIHLMHIPNEQDTDIAGGKNPTFYELECKLSDFIGKASVVVNPGQKNTIDYSSKVQVVTPSTDKISLSTVKNGHPVNSVIIGELLSLKFTGPDNFKIYPINCTAFAKTVGGTPKHELWSNDTCTSKDNSILEDSWIPDSSGNVAVGMYAFRFVSSDKVAIECFAHFCPVSDLECKKWCNGIGSNNRRRRDINKKNNSYGHYVQKVLTTFTVVENNIGANTSSGLSTNSILLLTALSILLALTKE